MKRPITTSALADEFKAVMETLRAAAGTRRDYCIQTRLGALQVTCYDEPAGAWIAAVWDEVPAGLPGTRLNPCSGKWNWHWQEFWPQGLKASADEQRLAGCKMIHAFAAAVAQLLCEQ